MSSPNLTPEERTLRAKIASTTRWAMTPDRSAATSAARAARFASFERQVDPDGTLDPVERQRRAESLQKAHMLRMSLAAAKARRTRKAAERDA